MAGDQLVGWAREHGIEVSPSVTGTGDGAELRGIVATASIEEGDLLLSVPLEKAVTVSGGLKRFGHLLPQNAGDAEGGVHVLALELMYHSLAHPADPWVLSLPASPQTPLEWGSEDLLRAIRASAKGAQLLQDQEKSMEAAITDILAPVAEKFSENGISGCSFTVEAYQHAVSLVHSRAFQVMINDDKQVLVLPFVDWLNHKDFGSRSESAVSFDPEKMRFNVRALEKYAKGDQIFISYGKKGNAELLTGYGFCLSGNTADSVSIKVGVDPAGGGGMMALAMLPRAMTLGGQTQFWQEIRWKEGGEAEVDLSHELMMLLRVCASSLEEMMRVPLAFQNMPISGRCEQEAFASLSKACEGALDACEKALRTVDAMEGDSDLVMRKGFVATMLRGEKKLLQATIERSGREAAQASALQCGHAAPEESDDY